MIVCTISNGILSSASKKWTLCRYAVCKLFVAPDDLEEMARTADRRGLRATNGIRLLEGSRFCQMHRRRKCMGRRRCAKEGAFTRLASELESGYLGQDCRLGLGVFGLLGCWQVHKGRSHWTSIKKWWVDEKKTDHEGIQSFRNCSDLCFGVLFIPSLMDLSWQIRTYVVSNLRRAKAKPCRWIWTVAMWPTSCESMEHRFRLPWCGKSFEKSGEMGSLSIVCWGF